MLHATRYQIWLYAPFSFFLNSQADTAFTQRKEVQAFIRTMVRQHHFNAKELTQTMNQVVLQPQIIESMNKPFEKKSWDEYKNLFLTLTA